MCHREILEAADHERARLHQVLHNSICQSLNALQIFVELHARRLRKDGHPETADAERLKQEFREAMTELKEVEAMFAPHPFELRSVRTELENLCRHFCRRTPCELSFDPGLTLPTKAEQVLLEIIREALHFFVGLESVQDMTISITSEPDTVALAITARIEADGPILPPPASWARRLLAARVEAARAQCNFDENGGAVSFSCILPT